MSKKKSPLIRRTCRCGKNFITTRSNVRWCSNDCRDNYCRALGLAQLKRYRAKLYNAPGSHSEKEWQDKLRAHGYVCYYCLKDLIGKDMTKDHMVPFSRGGSDGIENIVPCCRSCNARKNSLTATEFKKKLRLTKASSNSSERGKSTVSRPIIEKSEVYADDNAVEIRATEMCARLTESRGRSTTHQASTVSG